MIAEIRSLYADVDTADLKKKELPLLLIAAVFVTVNAMAYSLVADGRLSWSHFYSVIVWLAVFTILHLVLRYARPQHDPYIIPIIALLSGWGLVILDRLAPSILDKQVIWIVLAAAALLLASLLPSKLWFFRRYRYTWLVLGLLLLATTLIFGVNPSGAGARLWLRIPVPGRVYFQPSELLKLIMIVFLAGYLDEREQLQKHGLSTERFGSLKNVAPLIVMWAISLILLVWQRDLGAAALFLLVFLTLLYLATGNLRYVVGGLAFLAVAGIAAYFLYQQVAIRFDSWLDPWPIAREEGYQIVQSLYALASGNILGQGVGQGFPGYIPVVHTDFAFSALAEEWGLIGSLFSVIAFSLLAYRGLRTASLSSSSFRMYLAAGITVMLVFQSLIIMGGITRLLPLTGVTLPFVSYGGSSLIMSSLMLGFLINLSSVQNKVNAVYSANDWRLPTENTVPQEARLRLNQLALVIIIVFAAVALLVVYWTVARGPAILAREDNPRVIETERRIQRGMILDVNGEILAETVDDEASQTRRRYDPSAGPATGYYSLEYGTSGVERSFDSLLKGEDKGTWRSFWENNILHLPREGRDIRLTLDAEWQELAADLIMDNPGAVLLLSLPENDIRILVSSPTYDPNLLNEQFDALTTDEASPLLNRAVQGQYQPGLLIQPILLAGALDQGLVELGQSVNPSQSELQADAFTAECPEDDLNQVTFGEIVSRPCPGAMLTLAEYFSLDDLREAYHTFGLGESPQLPITEDTDQIQEIANPLKALVGQDELTVSPLQVALAFSTLANDGKLKQARLVEAIEDENGNWRPGLGGTQETVGISAATARSILIALNDTDGVFEYTVPVLSGPSGDTNSWYIGLAPSQDPRFLVVVVLEGTKDTFNAEAIGRTLLRDALAGSSE